MDDEKRRLYANIARVANRDADKRELSAGYGGHHHDGGAAGLREIILAWEAGLDGAVPNKLICYATDAQKAEEVLKAIAAGGLSPRDLEESPPAQMSPRDARITVQTLLDEGRVALDDRLKLQKAE